jgi:hypothetical protein
MLTDVEPQLEVTPRAGNNTPHTVAVRRGQLSHYRRLQHQPTTSRRRWDFCLRLCGFMAHLSECAPNQPSESPSPEPANATIERQYRGVELDAYIQGRGYIQGDTSVDQPGIWRSRVQGRVFGWLNGAWMLNHYR